jgi:hypothetical protein
MAVPLPAGRHEIALTYRNGQVARGFLLAGVTLLALLGAIAWRRTTLRLGDDEPRG